MLSAPCDTAVQLSAPRPDGEWTLTLLARRTYEVDGAGRLAPAPAQPGLRPTPEWDPADPERLVADMDLFTHKLRTDLVVRGHVHGDGKATRLTAEVTVAGRSHRLSVFGERRCTLDRTGRIVVSEPTPIERVPLRYTHAYGGRDATYEATHGNPLRHDPRWAGMTAPQIDAASPYLYPRNPCGRGYLIEATRDAVDRLALPQLEDPTDLLSPTRLTVGDFKAWYRMPLPQGTDWIDYGWYPRCAFFGVVPICKRFTSPPAEVVRQLVPPELAPGDGKTLANFPFEAASGASLPLQLPHLRGGEPVALVHIHPQRPRWELTVPFAPALAVDARDGTVSPVEPVLHTLVLEPDVGRLTVIWRGSAPALRRYLPQELATMPMRVAWRD
ncbi:DUF2169 family type VI secretion system accessory protein [Nannocystis bainbridge]|uniref:DUF2169 domain-containing protein n=1 Tax=Nannocystis bainbridge TaxID=2995303 RepID=A0ABT5EF68_9BACT|nr:DUF2169 domain-containing protein [Nannocystis bainbridge]MDC0723588.1 DUF2169 domain-containing protein [Nannocystis bainbridge]